MIDHAKKKNKTNSNDTKIQPLKKRSVDLTNTPVLGNANLDKKVSIEKQSTEVLDTQEQFKYKKTMSKTTEMEVTGIKTTINTNMRGNGSDREDISKD